MTQVEKNVHFPETTNWDAVFLPVEFHFLQGDDAVVAHVTSAVHDAVRALTDAIQLLKLRHTSAASKLSDANTTTAR